MNLLVNEPTRRPGQPLCQDPCFLESRSPYGSGVDGGADEKRMRLRYAGACRVCGVELPAKVEAIYERTTKTVRCVSHDVHRAVSPLSWK